MHFPITSWTNLESQLFSNLIKAQFFNFVLLPLHFAFCVLEGQRLSLSLLDCGFAHSSWDNATRERRGLHFTFKFFIEFSIYIVKYKCLLAHRYYLNKTIDILKKDDIVFSSTDTKHIFKLYTSY